jgi:hypothetical protein
MQELAVGSILGTVSGVAELPVVKVREHGRLKMGARDGTPCSQSQVIKYQWLFFMLIAPLLKRVTFPNVELISVGF